MVSSELWFGASAGFYNGVATQSLRSDRVGGSTLSKTLGTPTTRRRWTISFWIKRTQLGNGVNATNSYNPLMGCDNKLIARFDINDKFQLYDYDGNFDVNLISTMQFRDTSAWYNLVIVADIDGQTGNDRMKLYVNGVRQDWSGTNPTDYDPRWNGALAHQLLADGQTTAKFNGYASDITFLDGQAVGETSGYLNEFGEVKNGVWIPKKYSGSYGNNGFRLEFKGTGTSTSSGAVSSPTNIGDDSSGQNNHFAVSGLNSYDSNFADSPENVFATFNPLVNTNGSTQDDFTEGGLKIVKTGLTYSYFQATMAVKSGKWYAEFRPTSTINNPFIGVTNQNMSTYRTGDSVDPHFTIGTVWYNGYTSTNGHGHFDGSFVASSTFSGDVGYVADDIIGVAIDMDSSTNTVAFYKNGSLVTTKNLTANFNDDLTFALNLYNTNTIHANFGADSTFNGAISAGGNKDANGVGDFAQTVPSGHLALCTSNLPEPPISPNADTNAVDHFGILTYGSDGNAVNIVSGANDNTGSAIGGEINFSPDWVWIKRRNNANNHQLFHTNRGQNVLVSNENGAESDYSSYFEYLDSSNGFRLPATSANMNASGGTFVAWNWLANGTAPTKTYKVKVVADSTDYGHGTGSNKYQFFKSDGTTGYGTNGVDLDLQEGGTYTFDWSDSSAQGHPIRFSLTNDGTHSNGTSAGSEYTTGVVKDDSAYKTTITVASGVANLYYYCQNHSGMGAEIRTNTTNGSTNFDGSILSVSNANTTSGFSIVTYTGSASSATNGTASTIGHGLNKKPEWIWFLPRDAYDGCVYHSGVAVTDPADYKLILGASTYSDSNTAVSDDASFFNDTEPTTTVFSVGTRKHSNSNGGMVAVCFANVDGFSKFGVYEGNGDADGAFVYTGFAVKWVMIKNIDAASAWFMQDAVRDPTNVASLAFVANNTYTASTVGARNIDFLSNGFKLRTTAGDTNGVYTIVYMAFASQPYKFANAR